MNFWISEENAQIEQTLKENQTIKTEEKQEDLNEVYLKGEEEYSDRFNPSFVNFKINR